MSKRRVASRKAAEIHEPKGFTIGNLVNLGAIPLITGAIILVGFYYTTSGTLIRYGEDIKTLKGTVDTKVEADTSARTKIREDFLASQVKTAEGIAKLDTRLAVAEQQQKTANEALAKISDSLQRISTMPQRSR